LKITSLFKKISKLLLLSPGFIRYFTNTGWLFLERILGMFISLLVGVYVARYLGPDNYGLLSYANSFVGLFMFLATLGLDSILVRELVRDEKKRDELLGTTFILKIIGSLLLLGVVLATVKVTTNDSFTNLLIFIIALGTIFQSFQVIDFYFQSKVLSKYTVYIQIISEILSATMKLILIFLKKNLLYFAIVILIENIVLAAGSMVMYTKQKLSFFNWKLKYNLAKNLLKNSWPLMLSSITISIYMRIDQVMIKNILDTKAVGNYAVAVRLVEIWYFIPIAVTKSFFPAIINAKKISEKLYYERLQKLYDLMTWSAIGIALPIMLFSHNIIKLLFGIQYQEAVGVLQIYVWASVFVFLGCASGRWFLVENLQLLGSIYSFLGSILNVLLNILLIPKYGIIGAAWATLISYIIITNFILIISKRTRINFILLLNSFNITRVMSNIIKGIHAKIPTD
jgi:O-antigen/teichoic acid export membrane protein